jgi:alkaline phosphatase
VEFGSKTLKLRQNSNIAVLNGKQVELPTVVVYVDKNRTFYLPAAVADWMK